MKTYFKNSFAVTMTILAFASCTSEKKQDPFEISKQHVGLLTDSTQVKDLKFAFPNDSIVSSIKGDEFTGQNSDIIIYNSEGEKLLYLTPSQALDSTSLIKSVRVLNDNYNTKKNISTLSTFKDIRESYKISSINNLINTIVLSVNEINASFTIDKKELPANLRFDMALKIEAVQIPDHAKIKYFMIHW
ncbi:hypothetical protein SAMN04515667_1394 [Formosa sp. Hel1_31_208]|uniref:hypothetical protein n=1 Tax=Formosa sp. Hel1_31_208 TaxID=1798225 RepID=UPI00087CB4B2|nr:hypothetical protein [Formosa sp. Hel1_31_208]SDS09438.1 hypothetical protein SAMN04515667_1394 [Formosa sp. Hel1_31_208]